jgi:hypothetical protein
LAIAVLSTQGHANRATCQIFAVIDKAPAEVTPADVFELISAQRRGDFKCS